MTESNPILPDPKTGKLAGAVRLTSRGYDENDLEADKQSGKQIHEIMWEHATETSRREMISDYFKFREQRATEDIILVGVQKKYIELNDKFKRFLRRWSIDEIVKAVQKTNEVKK